MRLQKHLKTALFVALCLLPALHAQAEDYGGYIVKLQPAASLFSVTEAVLPELDPISEAASLYQTDRFDDVERLRTAGVLVYAEPNAVVTLDDPPEPVASLFSAEEDEIPWYFHSLGIDAAHAHGATGAGVRIGIVDSGVFLDHEDLQDANILAGGNFIVSADSPARSDVSDTYGHGTFVCGLIAAAENGVGIVGIAPDVELVPLKCFTGKQGSIADIAAAMFSGVDDWHCDILNMSLGTTTYYSTLREAVSHAAQSGVIVTAAVGNLFSGSHTVGGDPLMYPAAWPDVIGVGAYDSTETVCTFSYRNDSVFISAPGGGLRSLSCTDPAGYVQGSGTSYAAPVIAAAAALSLSQCPDLSAADFTDFLRETAWDLGASGYDTSYGYGALHIGRMTFALCGDLAGQALAVHERLVSLLDGAPQMWLASYSAEGRMLSLWDADENAAPPQQDRAASWKLFTLDAANLVPLYAPFSLYGKPYGE